MTLVPPPYARSWESVVDELGVSRENGLSQSDARRRLRQYGPNRLKARKKRSAWAILASQFKSLVVLLLVAAAALAFILGDFTEGFAVLAVIAINSAIGFFTEIKAVRSMEALHKMGDVNTHVLRDGQPQEIPAEQLTPGDIVLLEGGDVVTADARLIEASKLQSDESPLTGEAAPVSKQVEPVAEDVPLAERTNMIYKGTAIVRGSGAAIVTGTGMNTELGAISAMVEEAEDESTPLEKRLDALGRKLVWVVLLITVFVGGLGILRGKEMWLMVETAIALAVASIPEGLPIVATIALSRGMLRMARRQALVRRLASVETLGSTTIICTDKTGTLTENRMHVGRIDLDHGQVGRDGEGRFAQDGLPADLEKDALLREALRIGVLCNNASLSKGGNEETAAVGDPLEIALLEAGREASIERDELHAQMPEVREDAFETETKMMATYHEQDGRFYVAVKGAPEAVLECCIRVATSDGDKELSEDVRSDWSQRNEQAASAGYRVIAVARKTVDTSDAPPYEGLALVALLGLVDPPRRDVRASLERCHRAGVRVVMVTGDQPTTALNVAAALGLAQEGASVVHGKDLKPPEELGEEERRAMREATVFARVSPRQKLDLIALHQAADAIVAMTGDGVNDAPALKKADIGIAMGQRGTQVAREVADVVLKDDSFKTIVYAVQEGRIIFGNIRKFVLFLLSCNIGEILVILLASLINTRLPILPLQILFLNLVTDVFPALALGVGEGDEQVMDHPPRPPQEPILMGRHWVELAVYGLVIALSTLAAFLCAGRWLGMGDEVSVTVSFLTLATAQLWHALNMREAGTPLFRNEITRNLYLWGAWALCIVLLVGAVYIPYAAGVLHTAPIGLTGWSLVVFFSVVPVVFDWLMRFVYAPAPR